MKSRSFYQGLKGKLIIFFLLVGLVPLGIVAIVTEQLAENALNKETFNKLDAVHNNKKNQVTQYFKQIEGGVITLADNHMTRQALTEFTGAFKQLGEEKLQELYVKNNPHPAGEKDKLDFAPDASTYSGLHARYHPVFRKYLKTYDYYDIFLVDNDGNLVYTVYKELDYATNLASGKYKDENIATAYRKVKNSPKGTVWLEDFKPYAPSNGSAASFIATPVFENDVRLGTLIFQMPIAQIDKIMAESTGMGKTGETYMLGMQDFLMRNNSRLSKKGQVDILKKKVATDPVKRIGKGESEIIGVFKDYRGENVLGAYDTIKLLNITWILVAEIDEAEAFAASNNMILWILAISLASVVVVVLVGFVIGSGLAKPILAGVGFAKAISERDLTKQLDVGKRKDEVGDLSNALYTMNNNLQTVVNEMSEVSATLAATSEEINAAANNLSEGAQNQAASVEETSASTEELTSSIKQVSDHSSTMQEKSKQSLKEAQDYKLVMAQISEEMLNISASTEKIGDIVKVINDIADQTNLLSLNAAIEAARAGEHGRGFSVVAEAISALAARSSESTKEIEKLISESVTRINKGVKSVRDSNDSFDTIVGSIDENNQLVSSITKSMEEQHQGSEQIQKATEEINNLTQSVSASAEEMSSSTSELHNLAERLNSIVGTFKLEENGHRRMSSRSVTAIDYNDPDGFVD